MCRVCELVQNKQWLKQPYVTVKTEMDEFGIQKTEKKLRSELIKLKLTEAEIEQHNYNWTMMTGCWIEQRRKEEKEKLSKIKDNLELVTIKDGHCALCAINNDWINEGIFFRNWSADDVRKELEEMGYPLIITDKELYFHKVKHLSVKNKNVKYDDKKQIKAVQKDIKTRNELNTLGLKDHIDSQILTLSIDIRELEQNDLTNSIEYRSKVELLKSFIDLKLKSEGGDVQDVNIVNFWEKIKGEG